MSRFPDLDHALTARFKNEGISRRMFVSAHRMRQHGWYAQYGRKIDLAVSSNAWDLCDRRFCGVIASAVKSVFWLDDASDPTMTTIVFSTATSAEINQALNLLAFT